MQNCEKTNPDSISTDSEILTDNSDTESIRDKEETTEVATEGTEATAAAAASASTNTTDENKSKQSRENSLLIEELDDESQVEIDDVTSVDCSTPPSNEYSDRPSSVGRLFHSKKANLKMSTSNLNQVLPIEYPKDFQIIWKRVNYSVKIIEKFGTKVHEKQILHNLNGSLSSGQVTAIMGPSGAGKSTFLEVLSCRRKMGLTGEIKVKDIDRVRIAYVPQDNHLMNKLTVRESLVYACKLQCSNKKKSDYKVKVDQVIKQFGLEKIRNTKIGRCSGGQQKRVSISLELFSNPNILILDEPTTGLDSSSCALVSKLLKDMVDNPQFPMAIVATIHQPSWTVFTKFDQVYIMTRTGGLLYSGSPNKILPVLSKVGLECDKFNSPSDYIIEIAAEDYGQEPVQLLQSQYSDESGVDEQMFAQLKSLREVKEIRRTPLLSSIGILLQRAGVLYVRDIWKCVIRILSITLITVWLAVMFGTEIGKFGGCPMRKLQLYSTPIMKLSTMFEEGIFQVTQNSCCLFFGLMVGLISGMTIVVLEFPREMHIITKEYNNGWYSCLSMFITKTLIDIPMQIIIPSIYVVYIYAYTNQPLQYFREGYLLLVTVMVGFISESIGAISSAIFMDKPEAAAFAASAVPLPMILFGGFLVKYSRMPVAMQAASWLSLLKYAFEALMVSIYGFNRCDYDYQKFLGTVNASTITKPQWANYLPYIFSAMQITATVSPIEVDNSTIVDEDEEFIKQIYTVSVQTIDKNAAVSFDRSLILSYYELYDDNVLYMAIMALTIYYLIFKVSTYFIILARLNFKY